MVKRSRTRRHMRKHKGGDVLATLGLRQEGIMDKLSDAGNQVVGTLKKGTRQVTDTVGITGGYINPPLNSNQFPRTSLPQAPHTSLPQAPRTSPNQFSSTGVDVRTPSVLDQMGNHARDAFSLAGAIGNTVRTHPTTQGIFTHPLTKKAKGVLDVLRQGGKRRHARKSRRHARKSRRHARKSRKHVRRTHRRRR